MLITHRIYLEVTEERSKLFNEAGILVGAGFVSFDIEESDPRWEKVSSLVKQLQLTDACQTKFTQRETDGASVLTMVPSWHYGYPEPADTNEYLERTFNLKDYCEVCGVGLQQNAPFLLKNPPSWGRRSILQLNWVFDEYFVKPEVWQEIFKPLGVDCKPVLHVRTRQVIDAVVQLVIPSSVNVALDGYERDTCKHCGRTKYLPITRGFFPPTEATDLPIFKSVQYFGSGARAFKEVFVSADLYQSIKNSGLKGVSFYPCAEKA